MVFLPMNALPGVPPVIEDTTTDYFIHRIRPEENSEVWTMLNLYGPDSGAYAQWDFGYLPWQLWVGEEEWWPTPADDSGQIVVRIDVIEKISGRADDPVLYFNQDADMDAQWLDIWDWWEIELVDEAINGVPEHWIIDVSWATDDGAGGPTGTVTTKRVQMLSYWGQDDFLVFTQFNDADSTDLEDATDTESKSGNQWVAHSGTIEVTNGTARSTTTGAEYSFDAEESDVEINVRIDEGDTSGGVIGRLQDASNYWLLQIEDYDTVDPSLVLQKIVAGVASTEDSLELTGIGPFTSTDDRTFKLKFDGNNISGYAEFVDPEYTAGLVPTVSTTDSAFNTATKHGLFTEGLDQRFNSFSITDVYPGFNPIVWDTTPVTSSNTDTGETSANIYFYEGSPDPNSDNTSAGYYASSVIDYVDVIDYRAVDFYTGVFLIYVEAVSGDTSDVDLYEGMASASFDTWFDMFRANVVIVAPVSGSRSAVIDITVAIDDGSGSPSDAYPTVTKRVTLTATSTGP